MPRKLEIKKGERYGQLVIESEVENKGDKRHFLCLCDCGNKKTVRLEHIRSGHTTSCGCLQRARTIESSTKHGDRSTPLYSVWCDVKKRCLNPRATNYSYYGGRGIKLCPEWHEYENFKRDMGAKYKQGLELDRRDNDGPYSTSNCRWVTRTENNRNTRANRRIAHGGKTRCVSEWAEITGIKAATILKRLKKGWSVEKALTTAPRRSKK